MTRRDHVYFFLVGFFLTNAVLAELIGGKIIQFGDLSWRIGPLGPFSMSVGIIPWPVVFVTTDVLHEHFGKAAVRRLTFLTFALLTYTFLVLALTVGIPATDFSGVDTASYRRVFGQGLYVIIGSLTAFAVSQLVDVVIFQLVHRRLGKRMIWLRATGSTLVSQAVDTTIVCTIGHALPNSWSLQKLFNVASTNYTVKVAVAILATPLIYAADWGIGRYLAGERRREALDAGRELTPAASPAETH